ncbi:hypothetical protein ACFWIJ_06635 [Streptomyces sp. NPDC127079]|uniref:hypothetical protein n=1 Tax=Streptomyces sp. NPDC127079 TaxID=3347132 RepID=UPI00365F7254
MKETFTEDRSPPHGGRPTRARPPDPAALAAKVRTLAPSMTRSAPRTSRRSCCG